MIGKIGSFLYKLQDVPVLAGFYGVVFESFTNTTPVLCDVTTFGLSVEEASIVWQTILKTIIAALTMIWMFFRIINEKNKNKK